MSQQSETYRTLRMAILLPPSWLLGSIALVAILGGGLSDSISDYHGTPLRDVFVGMLMATGLGMIAYQGASRLEDDALNFAGLNAFMVALVPNSFQAQLDASGLDRAELLNYLRFTVIGFLVVAAAGILVDRKILRSGREADQPKLHELEEPSRYMIRASWVLEVGLALLVINMLVDGVDLFGWSKYSATHFIAAVLLVVNLIFVVATYAFPDKVQTSDEKRALLEAVGDLTVGSKTFYRVIAGLMGIGVLVGAIAILQQRNRAILFTEVWELVLFIVFWTETTWRTLRRSSS